MDISCYATLQAGEELQQHTQTLKAVGKHEVLIAIEYCGLCHSDIHLIDDDLNKTVFPFVPGHEIIGTVVEAGSDVVKHKVGDTVGFGFLSGSCGECRHCLAGEENKCSARESTLSHNTGGFASHIVAAEKFVAAIPAGIPLEQAGPLMCAGTTAFAPIQRYFKAGQKVAVVGFGGIGHLAASIIVSMGGQVDVISRSQSKAAFAKQLGVSKLISNTADIDAAAGQYDLVIDTVGEGDRSACLALLDAGGILCFLGLSTTKLSVSPYQLIGAEKTITGSIVSSMDTLNEMLQFMLENKIFPTVKVLPISEVNEGIRILREETPAHRIVFKM